MHDAARRPSKTWVDFYVGGGTSNPYLDKEIKELKLTGPERADLVAFLESLTVTCRPTPGRQVNNT